MDDPKQDPPDHTEDPRHQETGDGYPETAPAGAQDDDAEPGGDEDGEESGDDP